LQRVAWGFVSHLESGQPAQFLIDQRQQFRGGIRVAALDSLDHPGDIAHAAETIAVRGDRPEDLLDLAV